MKNRILIAATVISMGFTSCGSEDVQNKTVAPAQEVVNEEGVETLQIELDNSIVEWRGSMVGVYGHSGILKISSGQIEIFEDKIVGGEFVIDMNSMETSDAAELYLNASREDLINHLKSDEFFGVEKFPTAKFVITEVNGDLIMGDLTIKGVTKSLRVEKYYFMRNNHGTQLQGVILVNRQDFGVSYENTMNDMVIGDEMQVSFIVTTK